MEINKFIEDMQAGWTVEGFYILKDAHQKMTRAGKPFLSGSLSDVSGSIDFVSWDYNGTIGSKPDDIGRVVKIRGDVSDYNGATQISVNMLRFAAENDKYDLTQLVPSAPIDREQALKDIYDIVDSMSDEDYKKVASTMLERHLEAFKTIPAAKSVHHGFVSGLLMHTVNMLCCADFLAGLYAEVIDRSLLLTGTLLHDFAKEREFTFSDLGMVTGYSVKGQLLGHLVMGAQEAAQVCKELDVPEEKSILLQHMLLSHHGQPEYGAAVVPMCAEAEMLSYIDLIDSRMEIYAEEFTKVPVGEFSSRLFALDKRIYNHGV